MVKRFIILVSFLAYSLTLIHNLVPHQHEDLSVINNHRQHKSDADGHHHHDDKENDLKDIFSDAIHHPSAEKVIHGSESVNVQKNKTSGYWIVLAIDHVLLNNLKPPDKNIFFQVSRYCFDLLTNSHLRAPPAI